MLRWEFLSILCQSSHHKLCFTSLWFFISLQMHFWKCRSISLSFRSCTSHPCTHFLEEIPFMYITINYFACADCIAEKLLPWIKFLIKASDKKRSKLNIPALATFFICFPLVAATAWLRFPWFSLGVESTCVRLGKNNTLNLVKYWGKLRRKHKICKPSPLLTLKICCAFANGPCPSRNLSLSPASWFLLHELPPAGATISQPLSNQICAWESYQLTGAMFGPFLCFVVWFFFNCCRADRFIIKRTSSAAKRNPFLYF